MRRQGSASGPPGRPRSATSFTLSVVALCAALALIALTAPGQVLDAKRWSLYAPLLPCLGIVLVIGVAEWCWPKLRARCLVAEAFSPTPREWRRVAVRLAGLGATLAMVAFAYWLLPEYRGDFYDPYWRLLRTLAPLLILAPGYFWWMDGRWVDDEYQEFGALVCGRRRGIRWTLVRRHVLGWTVKAFFLPLMAVYLSNELNLLYGAFQGATAHTMPLYQAAYHLTYSIDLLYCVVGYTVAIRLFDAHIRSVEPTVAGWLVALVCYQPFYSVIGRFYLQYDDTTFWDNWLVAAPTLRLIWATAIIALISIYALCTVAFGLRFSNLTHRGIITAGPYRFSKHPAYLAKNLSWWLISVPFVSEQGAAAAIRHCCLLGLLNGVYYARARTEERHLSQDPTYVAYALWINEHGALRWLTRLLPGLTYRAPVL